MDLKGLNKRQREAVLADGIVRVIAGAGSGKTRVLTHRIAHLVDDLKVKPENILAVTFTRKAAGEMKQRLKNLIGTKADRVMCGTFHSVCLKILRESWNGNRFSILDDSKRKTYLKRVLGPEGINAEIELGKVLSAISLSKNRLISASEFREEADLPYLKLISKAYSLYEEWKRRDHLLDYDDLLFECWRLLKTDHEILKRYRKRFSHILVDEFQDTNHAQFEILKLLTPPQNNLFVVGDDFQSIYGFRGAEPENIIHFDKTFPKAKTIKLEQNYRSTKTIVKSSNKLISFNSVRTDKTLWTENPDGKGVKIIEAVDPDKEASIILKEIKKLTNEGISYKDIAVLYRTNAQSRPLEDECIKQKIPYSIVGSLGFYDRREIRDMIAYLRLIHDLNDNGALLRIINVPPRYLAKAFIRELERDASYKKQSLFVSLGGHFSRAYMARKAEEFQELILEFRQFYKNRCPTLSELLSRIRERTRYDEYISEDEDLSPDDSRVQNLNEFQSSLKRFSKIEDFLFYLNQINHKDRTYQRDQLNLMTLHKSKGLEFRVVFLSGCSQGILPHQKALLGGQIEEERRLCYVGMTRAMQRLYITYPRTYQGGSVEVSQFVKEVFPEVETNKERIIRG